MNLGCNLAITNTFLHCTIIFNNMYFHFSTSKFACDNPYIKINFVTYKHHATIVNIMFVLSQYIFDIIAL